MSLTPEPVRSAPVLPSAVIPGAVVDQATAATLPDVPPGTKVRIAGYREIGGILHPILEVQQPVEATPPRDLSPEPLLDRRAQRIAAGGIAAAGVGIGVKYAAAGIAIALGAVTELLIAGIIALAVFLVVVGTGAPRRGGSTSTPVVHNHNRGIVARSTTTIR